MIKRKPDQVINSTQPFAQHHENEVYLNRWFLIPKNHLFNIFLHEFRRSDDDRAMHDHPWWSVSFLLKGEMLEHQLNKKRLIPWMFPVIRSAKFCHKLELIKGPVWTIFITGPNIRSWGFYTVAGWSHWKAFLGIEE